MAEALGMVGASASILGIIHILGKTVITLHTLRSRYQEAAFTFLNLIAQLTALKAALNQLQAWMDTDIDEPHHQLVMDLELSVMCCRMLVGKIDDEVEGMEVGELDGREKIRMVMKNGTLEDLQKMVDRQTSALTLLLTVCNCKAVSEQKVLLEKTSTRKVFTRIRDDTSSLYVQRDSASFYSRCTDNFSRISAIFSFDNELFTTTVYSKAIRGTMKDALQTARRPAHLMASRYADQKRQEKINVELEEDSKRQKRICSVLMRGDLECAQLFIHSMKLSYGEGYSQGEREMYRGAVMRNILQVMEDVVLYVEYEGLELDASAKTHFETLTWELTEMEKGDGSITIKAACSLKAILKDEDLARILQRADKHVKKLSAYLINEIDRIVGLDYLPTDTDISTLGTGKHTNKGIQEHHFEFGALSARIIDISSQRASEQKMWIHQFQDVTSIAFFVDLSSYDDPDIDNPLLSSMHTFEATINSPWFLRSSIILFLCNHREFKEKLSSKPLRDYFPDYEGRDACEAASKYLLARFTNMNRSRLDLYPHFCESSDPFNGRLLLAALKETILQNAMVKLFPRQKG